MKVYVNKNCTEREFQEDDWVYLRLQPYWQKSVAMQKNLNLSPQFFGPFKILPHGERVSGGRLGVPEALVIQAEVCGYVEEFETIPMVF